MINTKFCYDLCKQFYYLGMNYFKDFWSYSDVFAIFIIYLSFTVGNFVFFFSKI